jgi:hypothetical protein
MRVAALGLAPVEDGPYCSSYGDTVCPHAELFADSVSGGSFGRGHGHGPSVRPSGFVVSTVAGHRLALLIEPCTEPES